MERRLHLVFHSGCVLIKNWINLLDVQTREEADLSLTVCPSEEQKPLRGNYCYLLLVLLTCVLKEWRSLTWPPALNDAMLDRPAQKMITKWEKKDPFILSWKENWERFFLSALLPLFKFLLGFDVSSDMWEDWEGRTVRVGVQGTWRR